MDLALKINTQRAGRDKLFRTAQYALKIVNSSGHDQKLKALEKHLSEARKLLRLGTFVDTLYGLRSTIHYRDPVLALTCSLSKLAQSLFLYYDALLWLAGRQLYEGALKPAEIARPLVQSNPGLVLNLGIHLCDLVLPCHLLGYLGFLPTKLVGVCGVLSSVGGLLVITQPQLKLSPP